MKRVIRGGLCADEVGFGKTTVICGLIDSQFTTDSQRAIEMRAKYKTSHHATLIVTPMNLFTQWAGEIKKFLGCKYKVVLLRNTPTLKKFNESELLKADIVMLSLLPLSIKENIPFLQTILHGIRWNRLVVDEYTYLWDDKQRSEAIKARSKWILSGTPGLKDFTGVKSIAQLLGVHLGIDDDNDIPSKDKRLYRFREKQSGLEKLQMYRPLQSDAWYENRRARAQEFLNRLARQNFTTMKVLLRVHHWIVSLSEDVRQAYSSLYRHLRFQRGDLGKVDREPHGFRDFLNKIIASAQGGGPEDALLKCCQSAPLKEAQYHVKICNDNLEDVNEKLKSWEKFKKKVDKMPESLFVHLRPDLWEMISGALQPDCDDEKIQSEIGEVLQRTVQEFKKRKAGNESTPSAKRVRHGEVSRGTQNRRNPIEDFLDEKWKQSECEELVSLERERLLWKTMLELHEGSRVSCSRCSKGSSRGTSKGKLDKNKLTILRTCGHVLCADCLEKCTYQTCPVEKCHSSTEKVHHVAAAERSAEGCSKLNELVRVITSIPESEQVLLFCQYTDILDKVEAVLTSEKIGFCRANNTGGPISRFQGKVKRNERKPKVLLLRMASMEMAGLYVNPSTKIIYSNVKTEWTNPSFTRNLQCANHVIFLCPIVTDSQEQWEAHMTQAIGRARRCGQKSDCVHIYHILAAEAADMALYLRWQNGQVLAGTDDPVLKAEPGEEEKVYRAPELSFEPEVALDVEVAEGVEQEIEQEGGEEIGDDDENV
ncbi:hypothetical protein N7532_003684 [Penicillium argentinense]|uniref:RING-type domain-containing protein n=1 Tax=Penicillium argentinense TaxID=1131581 RepID=A0A9W9KE43_9EURO|nr:uncharacterized protein N7532_003684 [Penicillium argentinense]KAJ5103155.1 hypothetical protein N7532_003684 [Penicillium argentinense]